MKKKILFVVFALFALISLASCNNSNKKNETSTSFTGPFVTSTATVAPTQGFQAVELTDQADRTVKITKMPERIISAYYSSTTICLALGLKDKLVAIEKKADTRELYKKVAPELLSLPGVSTKKEINVEAALNTNPDLVILPYSLKNSAASFAEVNVNVLVVNPESEAQFNTALGLIGAATGTTAKVEEITTFKNNISTKITNLVKDAPKPNVYLSSSSSYLSTCGSQMYQNSLINIAGGNNVAAEITGSNWSEISAESLLSYNPDYIFCVYGVTYLDEIKAYAELDAVKNDKIYVIPSEDFDIPSPLSVVGIMWMANKLHSDLYDADAYKADALQFYGTFFNITVEDSVLGL